MVTIINEPGMKGSALFGGLVNRELSVISSAPNIAHSEVCNRIR